jgi:dTDP-4-dehydrorhamnose reductase
MKILLLGSTGQVGWQLRRSLALAGEVIALDRDSQPLCGDLAQPERLAETVREVAPQAIVNAAAFTAVDRAESESELAFAINGHACEVLARAAQSLGAWLVHYSTDYVFDGSGAKPWKEDDATAPVNAYGRSKLEGERLVGEHCERHLIVRTSWVFDTWGQNFLKTILRAAAQRDSLQVVDDQWGAPTRAALVADATAHLLRAVQPKQAGIYHLAASGETNWHRYASFAIEEATRAGMQLKTTTERVGAVDSARFQTIAKRPGNSRLDTSKLRSTFGIALPRWEDGVSAVVREIAAFAAPGSPSARG